MSDRARGREVVLVHGMWGGPWCWDGLRQVLEDAGLRCTVPALRHHDVDPEAPPPPEVGTTSLLDYAADLEAVVRALPERPVLVGHSMGGLLVQMLAARGLGRAAVLLTPAWPAGILGIRPSILRSFKSVLLRWGFWRKPQLSTFAEVEYGVLGCMPEAERRPIYDRLVHDSGRAAAEIAFWPLDRRRASRVDPDRLTCPLLVVGAAEDRMMPASIVRKVAARYGDAATYWELPGHGHWLIGEPGWHELAVRIAGWISTHA